ncbi:MAG: aminomethyl-transferring glycine dehydrogenase subunit GcvPA [Candidatus Sumerlaeaceae bacterium]|nr:aminomethyl-transferring glycine dehydrogenase subunit GcvPA [Candidatus Sumerlaeaceae bacterium]
MINPYIETTAEQEREMLAAVGVDSIDTLFSAQVPPGIAFEGEMDLPPPLSEPELLREFRTLSCRDLAARPAVSFLGGGIYDHFCPAAVAAVANRAEFVTAYTPYQPEASQGTLQAFFEYQTMVSRLYGMDVSNASLYDVASALGEALFLALSARPDRRRIVVPQTLHPDCVGLACTYLRHFDVELVIASAQNGVINLSHLRDLVTSETAAVVVQHPNYFGCLEEVEEIAAMTRAAGALLIASCDPVALGVLAPPGEFGADIAVGEGQALGLRPYLGGETLGLFTCRADFMRRMPGRLVGLTRDRAERRGFVLTLQTREQHIRRDKATSNICTNHAHNALRATIYLALMGPSGLRWAATMCVRNLQRLRAGLEAVRPGSIAFTAPCFKETVVRTAGPARAVVSALREKGILAGIPLDRLGAEHTHHLLVCTTEQRTDDEIDALVEALTPHL